MKKKLLFAVVALVAWQACKKSDKPVDPVTNPPQQTILTISDFNPKSAMVDETVMITGTGFGTDVNAVGVKFGDSESIKPIAVSDSKMTVKVPARAKTGTIEVSISGKSTISATTFTLTQKPAPVVSISTFAPQSAKVGEIVTINGANFGTDVNFVKVKFGGSSEVQPKTVSTGSMTVVVPIDAQTGKVFVSVNGSAFVSASADFTLKPSASISDFSPKTFAEGDVVTITGSNFGNSVNDVSIFLRSGFAIKPTEVTPTKITATIPYDAEIGSTLQNFLRVSVSGSEDALSASKFTYQLLVKANSIDYDAARPGEIVNINVKVNRVNFGLNVADLNALGFSFGGSTVVKPLLFLNNGNVAVRVPSDAVKGTIQASYTSCASGSSSFIFTPLALLPQPQSGSWTKSADFRVTGKSGSVAFTIGGKAYVGLGYTGAPLDGYGSDDVWEFDPQYNAWMQKADFGGGLRTKAVAFSVNNKGYVGTGIDNNLKYTRDFWEYDPATNTWVQKANFKGDVRAYSVAFSIDNLGYVGSGASDKASYDDFYSYNPNSNAWIQIASIPGARDQAFAFAIGGNGYVGNGDKGSTRYADLYMYNPSSNTWTAKASNPNFATFGSTAFTIGDKAYVGLGRNTSTNDKFFEYSTTNNSWKAIANFGGGIRMDAVSFSINGIGYVGMGATFSNYTAYKDFWAYKP